MENNTKKVWGLYNNYENPKVIDQLREEDIWKSIDNLGRRLRLLSSNPHFFIPKEQLINYQYNLEYLVYFTRKFGVVFDYEPTEEKHVESSDSYKSWYCFWRHHFESMSEDEYDAFIEAKNFGRDVSSFMPEKSWQESAHTK